MRWLSLYTSLLLRSLRSPRLAAALIRVGWRFRRRAWYAKFPFLPVPSREYMRWRMHTAYGDHNAVPPVEDFIRYVRWAAQEQRARK